jgi:hypothetical protein
LSRNGFNHVKVNLIRNRGDHSSFASIDFKSDWAGFHNAMLFENSFEAYHSRKSEYYAAKNQGNKFFG